MYIINKYVYIYIYDIIQTPVISPSPPVFSSLHLPWIPQVGAKKRPASPGYCRRHPLSQQGLADANELWS